jgi:hypothetical protein
MNKETSGSGDGVSLSMGTLLGNVEGAPLPGTLRERQKETHIKRDVKMPCKRVSLSVGALLGNLEGICLPGLSE